MPESKSPIVVQVWRCDRCAIEEIAEVRWLAAQCRCGRTMKLVSGEPIVPDGVKSRPKATKASSGQLAELLERIVNK